MKLKTLLSYLLVTVVFLFNSVGVIIVYHQIKIFHKKAIIASIKLNSFDQVVEFLSFSKTGMANGEYDLEFIEEYEFRFKGKLFDIIEKWETKDSIFYKCINDTKEEEIEKAFIRYVVNNNHRQDLPLPIKQILASINLDLYLADLDFKPSALVIISYLRQVEFALTENFLAPPKHPPRDFS